MTREHPPNANLATPAERVLLWLLLTLLALAPLPFAGQPPWAAALLAGATGGLLLLWGGFAMASDRMQDAGLRRLWPAMALYGAVVVWAAVQAWATGPEAWRQPLWDAASPVLETTVTTTLSIDSARTAAALMRLLCYGGVFLLAFQLSRTRRLALWLLRGVVAIAIAIAYTLYGITIQFLGLDMILWYSKTRDVGQLSSTFPDRNAFATYAGISLIAALALLLRPKVRAGDLVSGWRTVLRMLLEFVFSRSMVSLAAVVVLFMGILMTHSRGGLGVTLVASAVFLFTVTRNWKTRKPAWIAACTLVLGSGVLFAIGGGKTVERMVLMPAAAVERAEVYQVTARAIAERPIFGTGYGTFQDVFPAHRSEALIVPFLHGHNMYLENGLELGVPAAAALFLAIGWIALVCARAARQRGRESFFPCIGIAITLLVALHSLFDSGLRIPAAAMTLAALLGMAAARAIDATGESSPAGDQPRD